MKLNSSLPSKIMVFWYVMLHGVVERCQIFMGACLPLHYVLEDYSFTTYYQEDLNSHILLLLKIVRHQICM